MREHAQQRLVEAAGLVALGRAQEFVVETETIQEGAQPRILVRAEAFMRAEGIGDRGQRLAEIGRQHLRLGQVVRHFAQAIHVVGKRDQPGRERRDIVSKAWRTQVVRATSPKVPICGRPDGP